MMKNFVLSVTLLLSTPMIINASPSYALIQQQEVKRVEIPDKNIPEEAKMDIIDKFHGAIIIKAFKEIIDGEHVGYMVTIKKGPEIWDVRYDIDGNPLNKVKPK